MKICLFYFSICIIYFKIVFNSIPSNQALLKHIQDLAKRHKYKPLVKLIKHKKTKLVLYRTKITWSIPEPGKCYDWRHFVFKEDYFDIKRHPIDYFQAVEAYKSVLAIKDLLKNIFGSDIANIYWKCWFPLKEAEYCRLSGVKNGLGHLKNIKTIQIDAVNLDDAYDIVMPGQVFPGIKLRNGLSLINSNSVPLFVIGINCNKDQIFDVKTASFIECMLLRAMICPCQQWLDWIQPKYSYPNVSSVFDCLVNTHLDANTLLCLSSLITKKQCLNFHEQDYFYESVKNSADSSASSFLTLFDMIDYNSGLQILKDLWPASKFYINVFDNANMINSTFDSFIKMLPDSLFKSLNIQRLIVSPSAIEPLVSNLDNDKYDRNNGISLFRFLSSSAPFSFIDSHFPIKAYIEARLEYAKKYLINKYMNRGQELVKMSHDINDTTCMHTAIYWQYSIDHEPIPTVKALWILHNLMTLPLETCGISKRAYNQGKLTLLMHMCFRSTPRQYAIWLDALDKGYSVDSFGLFSEDYLETSLTHSSYDAVFKTPLVPYAFGWSAPDDLLLLTIAVKGFERSKILYRANFKGAYFFHPPIDEIEKYKLSLPVFFSFA